ncbi:MAG: MerR family transcriptional regulator [Atopobiaceae bacterium]|nr:MerR family transcriptional regulator [Atopobiaceae bacterium]
MDATTYSISELASLSGTSVRTLHHYDHIGLLVPRRMENGYRAYGEQEVRRLQQILLWRTCGIELKRIKSLLDDPGYDESVALRSQLDVLVHRREQIDRTIENVRDTLRSLEKGNSMTDSQRFEGLKRKAIEDNERAYGGEVRARFGNHAADEANAALLAMDEGTWNDMSALEERIKELLTAAMATGDAKGQEAQDLVRAHARWLSLHWGDGAYNVEAHRGLADGYLADQRFVTYYDTACGNGATQFLHDAILANTTAD